jgi:hypothetical protein
MTALVFYGGAGINVILYCCNQCRSAGIETLQKDNGCEKQNPTCNHNSHSTEPAKDTCHRDCEENNRPADLVAYNDLNGYHHELADDDCCSIIRIHFDWNSHSFSKSEVDLSPAVHNVLPCAIIDIAIINYLMSEGGMIMPKAPPPVYPRDSLSQYVVLLI